MLNYVNVISDIMRLTLDIDSREDLMKVLRRYGNVEVWKSSSKTGMHYIIYGLTTEQVKEVRLMFDDKKRIVMDNLRTPLTQNVLFDSKTFRRGRKIYKQFNAVKLKDTFHSSIEDFMDKLPVEPKWMKEKPELTMMIIDETIDICTTRCKKKPCNMDISDKCNILEQELKIRLGS